MFKSIKNLKKDVEEIKDVMTRKEVIGKDKSFGDTIGYVYDGNKWSVKVQADKTLFERIESLEESISRIEKHLGIKWVKEVTNFEGYKTTKKLGRPRKNK